MQVSEIMHQGVISVDMNDSIKKVAAIMKAEDIGAVPVFDDGNAVGFVTDRDIVISCLAEGYSVDGPISHAMSEDLITITKESDVMEAQRLMEENKISRLLVIENEKPVGIISLHDLSVIQDQNLTGVTVNRIKSV